MYGHKHCDREEQGEQGHQFDRVCQHSGSIQMLRLCQFIFVLVKVEDPDLKGALTQDSQYTHREDANDKVSLFAELAALYKRLEPIKHVGEEDDEVEGAQACEDEAYGDYVGIHTVGEPDNYHCNGQRYQDCVDRVYN